MYNQGVVGYVPGVKVSSKGRLRLWAKNWTSRDSNSKPLVTRNKNPTAVTVPGRRRQLSLFLAVQARRTDCHNRLLSCEITQSATETVENQLYFSLIITPVLSYCC